MIARDGRELWFRDDAVLVRDEAGRPLYVQGVLFDITGLKLAERAVRIVSGRLLNLQEEERRRIARELHDTTAQNLTALTMNLSMLRSAVPQTNTLAVKALEECFRLTNQCVQEIRTFSYLLHPPVLEELGLARALHDYATGFQQRSGIKVELDLSLEGSALPKETEMTLFRVVQESLGNIHRHSGSRAAAIRMWRDGGEVWLEVQDAGKGIPAEQFEAIDKGRSHFGVGIAGMRERMQQLGGRLDIRSGPQGTTVQAIVPLGTQGSPAGTGV
jgi:signal transduction histidine kinase